MSITLFHPQIWASTLLSKLAKELVYAGAPCVNRNYEGDIANMGDTVKITSIGDPTISDYTKDTDLGAVEALTDAQLSLVINQAKSFNFAVDDIDKRQSANGGALMAEAAFRAAFGLADKADQFVAATMALQTTNPMGIIDATTATNVYDKLLVPASVKLDQNNVPSANRFIVLDPAAYGKLQLDSRFILQNESGTNALHNGLVGMAAGFTIYKSNNAFQSNRTFAAVTTVINTKALTAAAGTFNQGDVGLTVTGTGIGAANAIASVSADGTTATTTVNQTASATVADVAFSGGGQLAIAGSNVATSYAEQISKVEAYRPEKRFGDALKGLHLYGAKVVRPESLVVASVKIA